MIHINSKNLRKLVNCMDQIMYELTCIAWDRLHANTTFSIQDVSRLYDILHEWYPTVLHKDSEVVIVYANSDVINKLSRSYFNDKSYVKKLTMFLENIFHTDFSRIDNGDNIYQNVDDLIHSYLHWLFDTLSICGCVTRRAVFMELYGSLQACGFPA